MMSQEVEVLVVGGGQAGVAMSEHLSECGRAAPRPGAHRIAERWRTERWDSLVANGPAWHDRFPGLEFVDVDPDAFASKEQVADYFVAYAEKIGAPIRCGVEVTSVRRNVGRPGLPRRRRRTGTIDARFVVAATGPFQRPVIPADRSRRRGPRCRSTPAPTATRSSCPRAPSSWSEPGPRACRSPTSCGGRAGASTSRSARTTGPRGATAGATSAGGSESSACGTRRLLAAGAEHVTIAVSGARRRPHRRLPRPRRQRHRRSSAGPTSFDDGILRFAPDLADNIANGDANYLSLLDAADAYVERNGLDLPEEPEARILGPDPDCVTDPLLELDLADAGVTSIIWATGFATDYSWLQVDAFDENGKPQHRRGVSTEPGVYFLGLPWLSRRGSSFIWGVWHDAKYLADHIATQRGYLAHNDQHALVASGAV